MLKDEKPDNFKVFDINETTVKTMGFLVELL